MLAIIGGTGIYSIDGLSIIEKHDIDTPYGKPSAEIIRGMYQNKEVLFLPRHGNNHSLLPSEVNYRANIWALKSLSVTQIIGLSAVGSLQQEIKPGDLAIADQYFDFVKSSREKTFFGEGLVAHVSTAEPTCLALADAISDAAKTYSINIHRNKTYACVDGPRLGTKAESLFLKNAAQCDLVGMTNVPEVFLAREAQICYCTIAIATDYDCWQDDPKHHVTVEQVISRYGSSITKAKLVLEAYLKATPAQCTSNCNHALKSAMLTPVEAMSESKEALYNVLSA
ncbi:S-methyl-5'-thioadenosine phosphorylase [Pseudocolwellia agarivorans]|uniref:S-methyl-5'-thioadenosine phosphorylase n=1 Tax=Pseudocolwellia agarivorans TaxID=1911682 RepID=UPI000987A097|nr:S-methyl-5'-thioadenosine phosphorylase [Pseudocolwellia agarivorans]